jgi:hypothetical protein
MRTLGDLIQRVRAAYLEMPGLELKAEHVQHLCGIERTICQMVLDSLLDEKFLCAKADGYYARLTTNHDSHSAKADVRTAARSKTP